MTTDTEDGGHVPLQSPCMSNSDTSSDPNSDANPDYNSEPKPGITNYINWGARILGAGHFFFNLNIIFDIFMYIHI